MKHEVFREKQPPFQPVSVTLIFENQAELDSFATLVNYSYAAAVGVETRAVENGAEMQPGVDCDSIDSLLGSVLFNDLIAQGARV